jgi:type II secretory pathway pseudopilin PulG
MMGMRRRTEARGTTLIETMIAAAILLACVAGLIGLFAAAVDQNETQGNSAARTTEYAQDKIEQLMKLSFTDTASDTRVFPVATSGGSGLGGTAASTTYGSVPTPPIYAPPEACTSLYVDYLDELGNLLTTYGTCGATPATTTPPSAYFYTRQWSIVTDATATYKTITVVVTARPLRTGGTVPSTTLICIKAANL